MERVFGLGEFILVHLHGAQLGQDKGIGGIVAEDLLITLFGIGEVVAVDGVLGVDQQGLGIGGQLSRRSCRSRGGRWRRGRDRIGLGVREFNGRLLKERQFFRRVRDIACLKDLELGPDGFQ